MADQPEPKRHSWLQEEARMLTPLYKAEEATGTKWRSRALCSQFIYEGAAPINAWFAPDGTDQSLDAVTVCFECPVRRDCLRWSCVAKPRYGIWGGQPASVRLAKGDKFQPHCFDSLVERGNPYDTSDPRSHFHRSKVAVWDGVDEDAG